MESGAWCGMKRRKGWSGFRVESRIPFMLSLLCLCHVLPITTLLSLNSCWMPVGSGHPSSWQILVVSVNPISGALVKNNSSTFAVSRLSKADIGGQHPVSLVSLIIFLKLWMGPFPSPALVHLEVCHHSLSVLGIPGSHIHTTSARFSPV